MRFALLAVFLCAAQEGDKRFPPLKVPEGFRAALFASDPLIEYPSVIALGPRAGSIFIPHDYMTGLGTEIVKRDEIRLVEDTDGDGRADKTTIYAGGFNSIQGLATHAGTVYAMHAPFLTSLRDTDGDGKADERKDLLAGLGWVPEKAPDRLHGANGVTVGHDGWLYLALGDRGCDVQRPEGDRLVHHGGAILRCRPDGRDLHVFSTGLRNIYDVALDEELNVFVRDNENDGGTYMIRVCHSFFGAHHGYPYHYEEYKAESMSPLADLGRGSSAGGVCYLESAFPPEYRGNLLFCEWGRSLVRYARERRGSSFAPMKEIDFASGGDGDSYGFKPTDLVVDRDGSILVSDWCDDQRPKRGRGRVYRISSATPSPAEPSLDAAGYHARLEAQRRADPATIKATYKSLSSLGRLHAVWLLDPETLYSLAAEDPDPRVRAQAVRALADRTDPVLVQHRLDAPPADAETAGRIAALGRGQDPRVLLEVIVALGRLRWSGAPDWLRENIRNPDPALAHAAQQTLRRCGTWAAVVKLLDTPLREIALRAAAEQAHPEVVDALIPRIGPTREAADALTRVHRKPGPWVYWGFRPGPRPANTEAWERTEAIERTLDGLLGAANDPDCAWILRRMQRENVPARTPTLVARLKAARDPGLVAAIVDSLTDEPALEELVLDRARDVASRLTALGKLKGEGRLFRLAERLEESPVLSKALRGLGTHPPARPFLLRHIDSSSDVRLAALESLAELGSREAIEPLLKLAPSARTLAALRRLQEPRAVPLALASLKDRETVVSALGVLTELGTPSNAEAIEALARGERSSEILQAAVGALSAWKDGDAIARIHGTSGVLLQWTVGGRPALATGPDSSVSFQEQVVEASSDLFLAQPSKVQFLASSNGMLRVSLNGRPAYQRADGPYRSDSDRFDADLEAGLTRVKIEVSARRPAQFHARFRLRSAKADHERLMQAALTGGNADRGREVFQNPQKPGCVKCHRIGPEGARIGPDLTGVGRRFSRVHLIESILEPSRTILPAFQNWAVKLKDGRILSGVKVLETEAELSLGDTDGKTHVFPKSSVEQQKELALSLMPEGLERGLTDREFVDLVAYLSSLR
jgi:putative membrane-bound dehydrogenase-like protein